MYRKGGRSRNILGQGRYERRKIATGSRLSDISDQISDLASQEPEVLHSSGQTYGGHRQGGCAVSYHLCPWVKMG